MKRWQETERRVIARLMTKTSKFFLSCLPPRFLKQQHILWKCDICWHCYELSPRYDTFSSPLVTFSSHSLSPEKSTQSGQRTAGDSEASARQQRPPVFSEFGSQTNHMCSHRAQVNTHKLFVYVCGCPCSSSEPFLFLSIPLSLMYTNNCCCAGACVCVSLCKDNIPPPLHHA